MKVYFRLFIVIAATVLLNGCGLYSKYNEKCQVPENIFGEDSLSLRAMKEASVAEMSWREFFTDPCLKVLIDSALTRNTDLKSKWLAAREAQLDLKLAKWAYLPSVYLNPGGAPMGVLSNSGVHTYNVPLQMDLQLDFFGSLLNKKRMAEAMLKQADLEEERARVDVISTVATLYNTLVIYDRQMEILLSTEKLWAKSLDTQRALWENGKSYSISVNQMEASYLSIKTQIVDMRHNIHVLENDLCRVLAITPRHIERSGWEELRLPEHIGSGVPASLLNNRTDVKVAEAMMEVAFYNTKVAKAAFFPNITLGGLIGWSNGAGGMDAGSWMANAFASMTQPIFARGRLRADLKRSRLTQEDIRNRYIQTVLNAGSQVNTALGGCQKAHEKAIIYAKQVKTLQDAYVGTHELMNNGKANYLEVLTAQEALLRAQLDEAYNIYDGAMANINLYIALGGGTK